MRVLFIYCHPEPNSFNASLVRAAVDMFKSRGDEVEVSDLYALGFDPVEKASHYKNRQNEAVFSALSEQRAAYETDNLPGDVATEIDKLESADLVVLQFPIWWHSAPAMLKGWMDRVFVSGGLYTSKMRYDHGKFRGKRAICSVTTGAPAASFEPGGRGGEIRQILWSTQYSLYYLGFDVFAPHVTYGIQGHGFAYADDAAFQKMLGLALTDFTTRLSGLANEKPMPFPGWDDWDELGQSIHKKTGLKE